MGSKSRRFPASEIVNFDLGYMVWLVILLLGFRIRPADHDYRWISNTSISHIESYHLEQEEREVIAMPKFANDTYQQIGNHSSEAMHLPPPEDLNLSKVRRFDLSESLSVTPGQFLYFNASELWQWRPCSAKRNKKRDSNLQEAFFVGDDSRRRPMSVASDMKQIEVVRENRNPEGTSAKSEVGFAYDAFYLDSVPKIRVEFDKVGTPKQDLVSYLEYFLIATSIQQEELRFLSCKKVTTPNFYT